LNKADKQIDEEDGLTDDGEINLDEKDKIPVSN
jgi:hypothetical protein